MEEKQIASSDIDTLINSFVERSKDILQDNLVGIYLHGSLAMDCFNPQRSDIDLIIVVNNSLSDSIKREYMEMVVEHNTKAPKKGIEMSVVLKKACKPFVYPTPFELHFSAGYLDWYKEDPDDYIHEMKGTDKDLAAHFTIINKRGKCLFGLPINEVFLEVPASDYMNSIWYDVEHAKKEIKHHPMYLTLNLARVLAYKEEGLVLSKKEGAEWAINNLPEEYHPLIRNAFSDYVESIDIVYDKKLAKHYARYMIRRIKQK